MQTASQPLSGLNFGYKLVFSNVQAFKPGVVSKARIHRKLICKAEENAPAAADASCASSNCLRSFSTAEEFQFGHSLLVGILSSFRAADDASPTVEINLDKEVSKFARNAATTFAPRASGATKNPAYKGTKGSA